MPKRPRTVRSRPRRMTKKRKTRRYPSRPKALALKMHNFVERHTSDFSLAVAKTPGVAVGHHMSFTLDQIRQASHYKELFGYYRINKIVATFRYKSVGPLATQSTGVSATLPYVLPNEVNPQLIFKVDHNDDDTTTIEALKNSSKTKVKVLTNGMSEFTIVLKPAVLTESYKTALSTAYTPKWNQWLSMDDSNVPHYGLKVFALGTDYIDNNGSIEISYKTYFSCKSNE